MVDNDFQSSRERDPIAKLARLKGRADPPAESASVDTDLRKETASDCHDELPLLPLAPQLPIDSIASEQAFASDAHCQGDQVYDADDPPWAADDEHQNEMPRVRRRSPAFVIAILCLALVGTAGAFGYRYISSGSVQLKPPPATTASNELNKIALTSTEPLSKDGPAITGSIENSVLGEEQSATSKPPKAAARSVSPRPSAAAGPTTPARPHTVSNSADPPGPTRTTATSQRPGKSDAADASATPQRTHLALASIAPADGKSTAAVTPSVLGSGYAVQVASERSERKAQAAFRALQGRYPNQLSGRQMVIRRVDLGAAGTYYRALVGPFASADKAAKLCSGLKAAGGDCIVQKN
jgi:hypothetical protein